MARRAEGWRLLLDERYGTYRVRFTHRGRRVHVATGETDQGAAQAAAARIYAEHVSGRRQSVDVRSHPFEDLASLWLESIEPELDPLTYRQYEMYCSTHLGPFFRHTDQLTDASCADYSSARLRKVTRSTVSREVAVLRRICAFGVERGLLDAEPRIRALGKRVLGTRAVEREHRAAPPEDVERFIAALPVLSSRSARGKKAQPFPVRARWVVAWETGLRPATLDELRAPDDYSRGAGELVIRDEADKARYGRTLPLTERAQTVLDEVCPELGLLFGRHDYRRFFDEAEKATGIHLTPYDLRHSRLTLWASTSTDLTAIGYLAGHRHATTTARYVHQARRGAEQVLLAAAGGFRTGSGRGGKTKGGKKRT